MALIVDPERARKLADSIVSDLILYNREKIDDGQDVSTEMEEGRALFQTRVDPSLFDVFDQALGGLGSRSGPRAHVPAPAPAPASDETPTRFAVPVGLALLAIAIAVGWFLLKRGG